MAKTMSKSSPAFAKGGPSGLVGKQKSTGTQKPGQTAQMGTGGGKFAKGGPSGKVGNQVGSMPAKAGISSAR